MSPTTAQQTMSYAPPLLRLAGESDRSLTSSSLTSAD